MYYTTQLFLLWELCCSLQHGGTARVDQKARSIEESVKVTCNVNIMKSCPQFPEAFDSFPCTGWLPVIVHIELTPSFPNS